ncbi:MAG: hypothetical protein IJW21_09425 [Clostridia bacterium]|nr:hypothetical protein [Clostridia bacterium]
MKKIASLILCAMMMLSALALVSCGGTDAKLKLGLGVHSVAEKATNADGDTNGQAQAVITAAAVLVDADGKIVKCFIDVADNTVAYTSEGKAVANESFKTKYELGYDYNMKKYGSAKEWFEQVDAFCALVEGKTVSEVKALVAEGGKGTSDVVSAGCTIAVSDFAIAVEKAVKNAVASEATAKSTLKLGVATEQTNKDASEDASGESKLETTLFAAAVDADGKIVAASSECVQIAFTFDANGTSTFDTTKAISGKRELGDSYGMKNPNYGSAKEWYEHANAFETACIGKKAGEVTSLLGENGYGNADLQAAGCTVVVSGFVKAASKVG